MSIALEGDPAVPGLAGGALRTAGIVGVGTALPERVVPNAEITPAIGV